MPETSGNYLGTTPFGLIGRCSPVDRAVPYSYAFIASAISGRLREADLV